MRRGAAIGSLLVLGLASCGETESVSAPIDAALAAAVRERVEELEPGAAGIGRMLPDLAFTAIDGRAGRLSDARASWVIAVRDVGCPVSRRTAAELARIEDEFRVRGVSFLFLDESSQDTPEELRADVVEHGFDGFTVHDPEQTLGRILGARTTTEVFVVDAARTLVYRGAIDDRIGRGFSREEAQQRFLRDALEQTLAGERVSFPATSAPGCLLGIEPETSAAPVHTATYHREVARILQQRCVECHRSGGAAPFSLERYADVRGRKAMIRLVVEERVMPPWFAAPDCGPWRNDRRLSEDERTTLLAWIEAGAPEGDPAEAPMPRTFREGWSIGEPDLVFQLEHAVEIPAEGAVDFRYFEADRIVPEDLWIEAMQVLPTDPEVVHHVTVQFQPPRAEVVASRAALRAALLPWTKRATDGWQFLFPYLPGNGPRVHAPGIARFVPKGSRLRFDMHYTPKGTPTVDRTRFGVVLAVSPPALLDESRNVRQLDLALAPGAKDVAVTQEYTLRHDVVLQSLTPHMHLRGAAFRVELERPDGAREELLRLLTWDPGWQFTYEFAEPKVVAAGSRLLVTGWYDNSADNPHNPDPTQWVHDGPQVWDEMLSLVIEWVRPRPVDAGATMTE